MFAKFTSLEKASYGLPVLLFLKKIVNQWLTVTEHLGYFFKKLLWFKKLIEYMFSSS